MPKKRNSRSSRRVKSAVRAKSLSVQSSLHRRVVVVEQNNNVLETVRRVIIEETENKSPNKTVEISKPACDVESETEFVLELEGNEFDFALVSTDS